MMFSCSSNYTECFDDPNCSENFQVQVIRVSSTLGFKIFTADSQALQDLISRDKTNFEQHSLIFFHFFTLIEYPRAVSGTLWPNASKLPEFKYVNQLLQHLKLKVRLSII